MRRATTTIRQRGRKKKEQQQYHHNTNRLSSVVNTLMNEPNKTVMPNKRSRGQQKSLRMWNFIRYKFLGFAFRLCTRLNGCTHHPPLLPLFFMSALFNALRRQPFLDSCSVFFLFFSRCWVRPKRGCSVMRTDPADAEGPRRFVAICSGIALCMCSHFSGSNCARLVIPFVPFGCDYP